MDKLISFIILILLFSCSIKTSEINLANPPLSSLDNEANLQISSDILTITAIDLSEDMSRLSTKNDEIFVFIYDYSDTNKLKAPLVSTKLVFDKDSLTQTLSIPKIGTRIVFFIEEDSFRNLEQIEPIVRIYFKEIMNSNDYTQIKKYLGEDDLLGIQIIDSNTSSFTISGMSSLDKFNYSFVLK